jgi:purine-binding chemotaxis protein CheW
MMETENSNSYLTFELGGELFSISVFKVMEIIEFPDVTKVPNSPDYLLGVINLRGNVLPLVDTRHKFAMDTTKYNDDTSVIIMELMIEDEKMLVGGVVDKVLDVINLPKDQVKPSPTLGSKYKPEFILGMGEVNDKFYMLIDIDKVFSTDEIILLKGSH